MLNMASLTMLEQSFACVTSGPRGIALSLPVQGLTMVEKHSLLPCLTMLERSFADSLGYFLAEGQKASAMQEHGTS